MTCRYCGKPRHRKPNGQFDSRQVCVWYRYLVADFYDTLERWTEALRFFRDDTGRLVNEQPGPLYGGGGCIA